MKDVALNTFYPDKNCPLRLVKTKPKLPRVKLEGVCVCERGEKRSQLLIALKAGFTSFPIAQTCIGQHLCQRMENRKDSGLHHGYCNSKCGMESVVGNRAKDGKG